jgi:hypothetical protein
VQVTQFTPITGSRVKLKSCGCFSRGSAKGGFEAEPVVAVLPGEWVTIPMAAQFAVHPALIMGGRQSGSEEWQVISLGSRRAENSEAVGRRAAARRKGGVEHVPRSGSPAGGVTKKIIRRFSLVRGLQRG